MFRATLRSLLARKVRLILSGLAVVLGVMFVSGSFVLTDTLGRSFDALFSTIFSETDVAVSATPKVRVSEVDGEQVEATLPASTVDAVRRVPGVAAVTPIAMADGARLISHKDGKVVSTLGAPRFGQNWTGEDGLVDLREGRGPTADNEIAVNAGLAEMAGITVGDQVGVLTLQPKRTFTLVGVYGYSGDRDSLGGSTVIAFTTPVAQELMLGEKGRFTSLEVTAAEGTESAALRDRIAGSLGDGFQVKTGAQLAEEQADQLQEGLSFFKNILLGFAGVALFVGIFLILNTFSIIVAQRTRELALMRAIGASRRQMIGAVLLEAIAIGLIASVLGLAAGVGVGALLAWVFGRVGGGLELAGIGVPPAAVISAFAVGVVVTVVAALLPALRASRIPPVAALQDVATPDRPLTRITIAGAVVGAVGGSLLGWGLSGRAGNSTLWTILAGVLVSFIGVALLTPLISRPVVAALGLLFTWSVPGRLGQLNSGRNPRRTAITAAALMVGIALITGVSVILDSAKASLSKLAADKVQAELFISGEQSGPRPPSFDAAVLDRTAALPGVSKVAGLFGDLAALNGEREYVMAANDAAAVRDIFGLTTVGGTVGPLAADQAIMDEPTAKELNLTVGQRLTLQLSRGDPHTYTVVGVYADSDLFGGILLPRQSTADFGIPQPREALVQLAPGTTVDQVMPQVNALLADSPEVSVTDRAGFVEQQSQELDTLLVMIQVLLTLAIIIAVLGVVNTLALSVLERTRELGLVRAIGLNRRSTMGMVTVEAVVISVFGAVLGVTVGSGLGAAVVRALRDDGITELVLPWSQMAGFLLLAALVGVVAAVLPAIRAARINVLGAIAYE